TLRQDINATSFEAVDTYFAGKSMQRAAQLLEIAQSTQKPRLADSIKSKLKSEFNDWFTGSNRTEKSFHYNPRLHGIVGDKSSFGSEDFNDHHFHYGYFIYAASILSKY